MNDKQYNRMLLECHEVYYDSYEQTLKKDPRKMKGSITVWFSMALLIIMAVASIVMIVVGSHNKIHKLLFVGVGVIMFSVLLWNVLLYTAIYWLNAAYSNAKSVQLYATKCCLEKYSKKYEEIGLRIALKRVSSWIVNNEEDYIEFQVTSQPDLSYGSISAVEDTYANSSIA